MRRLLGLLALLTVLVATAVPVALSSFVHSERRLQIGAHEAVVRPNFDAHAILDFGPLLPRLRLPVDAPARVGVDIALGDSQVQSLEQLVARDAVIASQPQGEIRAVRDAVVDMAVGAALRGTGVGLVVALAAGGAWVAVGPRRRRELLASARRPTRRQGALAGVTAVVLAGAVVLVVVPDEDDPRPEREWVAVSSVFPELPDDPVLDQLELSRGSAARTSRALVQGALSTYRESVSFYGGLEEKAREIEVRTPGEDETTALVVTDRHDNIGMDPVARAVADRAEAELLIDLGDDTSQGGSWEEFSINSLAREFDGFDVVAVAGNHDTGETVPRAMADAGFEVLDGEPVTVGGVRFLGASDPRSSGLTAGYLGDEGENAVAVEQQDAALTEAACADEEGVAVLAVHSPRSARSAAESGCVDLVLSGHLHRQVGPDVVEGPDGETTTTFTTASTGGAVYAFALGSKLRRQAQVTIVTFADGRPVGLQPVTFQPGGAIEVADYLPIGPDAPEDDAAPE